MKEDLKKNEPDFKKRKHFQITNTANVYDKLALNFSRLVNSISDTSYAPGITYI